MGKEGESRFQRIPVANLIVLNDPRRADDGFEDLVESFDRIDEQLQPILARPRPGHPGEFEVIAGRRRVRAARAKGWTEVEAKVVEVDDVTAEVYMLEENLRRRPISDPTAMARLVELYETMEPTRRGGDHRSRAFRERKGSKRQAAALVSATRRAAQATRKSERDVRRLKTIGTHATPKVLEALQAKRINVLQAERLCRMPDQDAALDQLLGEKTTAGAPDAATHACMALLARLKEAEAPLALLKQATLDDANRARLKIGTALLERMRELLGGVVEGGRPAATEAERRRRTDRRKALDRRRA